MGEYHLGARSSCAEKGELCGLWDQAGFRSRAVSLTSCTNMISPLHFKPRFPENQDNKHTYLTGVS